MLSVFNHTEVSRGWAVTLRRKHLHTQRGQHLKLALQRCTDETSWDRFVEQSAQGNIFVNSKFLKSLNADCELYFVLADGQPALAVPLLLRDGAIMSAPYPLTMYQGLMFGKALEEMPHHRCVPLKLRLVDYALAELAGLYSSLSFCLHYNFGDVRSLQWFNYHEPQKGQFQLDVRYTGLLDLDKSRTLEQYLAESRDCRRQEYRHAIKHGITIETCTDTDLLNHLHDLTFKRQGLVRSSGDSQTMLSIAESSLRQGFGKCFLAKTQTGEPAAAALFLFDDQSAYYLIGANHPDFRKTGAATYLLFYAIDAFRASGTRYFDFVGINSPNRGDFKTSFNARPKPYFLVSWSSAEVNEGFVSPPG